MTLPKLNTWIEHDGSADCPLPVGTAYDLEIAGTKWRGKWREVRRFRVISYPEKNDEQ